MSKGFYWAVLFLITANLISIGTSNIGNPNWNITGTWTYNYYLNGNLWPHTMVIDVFHQDSGQFRGYVDDPSLKWLVYGVVEGDNIKFQIIRMTGDTSYYTDLTGVISSNTFMSGDAVSPGQIATWNATRQLAAISVEWVPCVLNTNMTGTVSLFTKKWPGGFINGDDGGRYFYDETGLTPGTTVTTGDRVNLVLIYGEKGLKADKIRKI